MPVDELQDEAQVPGGDALEVEHDGGVGGEGRLLLEQRLQDGRGGGEDDLVGPQCRDGPVLGLDGEGDIEELLLAPDVGKGAAQAPLEVIPGDVVVLCCGSHDDH